MVMVGPFATEGHCTSKRPAIRCKAVLRRVRCDLQHTTCFRVTNAWARYHCAGRLSGGGAARAHATRTRCVALVLIGLCVPESHCTSRRPLPFAARPWYDVPGAASRTSGLRVTNARARHCAGCLLGEGAVRALATRARCAAMGVVDPRATKVQCTSERSLPFGARPWCDVPGAAFRTNRLSRGKRACAPQRWLSLYTRIVVQHARLQRTRAALRWLWSTCVPRKATAPARGLPTGARPSCDVSAAASNTQPAFAWQMRGRATTPLAGSRDEA